MVLGPRANVIKLFTAFHNKLELVPGKPLQPCLMLTGKAGAYPSEAPFRCSSLGVGSLPHPQTLDLAGKACQGQML